MQNKQRELKLMKACYENLDQDKQMSLQRPSVINSPGLTIKQHNTSWTDIMCLHLSQNEPSNHNVLIRKKKIFLRLAHVHQLPV